METPGCLCGNDATFRLESVETSTVVFACSSHVLAFLSIMTYSTTVKVDAL